VFVITDEMHLYYCVMFVITDLTGMAASDNGPIVFSIDDTKPDGNSPGLMGFLLAKQARQLCTKTREER
jgi:hypothetical protein